MKLIFYSKDSKKQAKVRNTLEKFRVFVAKSEGITSEAILTKQINNYLKSIKK